MLSPTFSSGDPSGTGSLYDGRPQHPDRIGSAYAGSQNASEWFAASGFACPGGNCSAGTGQANPAIGRFGITYPVAQDNQYTTWKAFDNEYWPATYLIDRNGHVVLKHVGEGDYEETERAIEVLLGAQGAVR